MGFETHVNRLFKFYIFSCKYGYLYSCEFYMRRKKIEHYFYFNNDANVNKEHWHNIIKI